MTSGSERDVNITGNYRVSSNTSKFSCTLGEAYYRTTRQILKRYGLLEWTTDIEESLEFKWTSCSTGGKSGTEDPKIVKEIEEAMLNALTRFWLEPVMYLGNVFYVEPYLRIRGNSYKHTYRQRILSNVIGASFDYLKHINLNSARIDFQATLSDSFAETPWLKKVSNRTVAAVLEATNDHPTSHSQSEDTDFTERVAYFLNKYNLKIVRLFDYIDNKTEYSIDTSTTHYSNPSTAIIAKWVVFYEIGNSAAMIISPKKNPNSATNINIESIEFKVHFRVESINEAYHFDVSGVDVNLETGPTTLMSGVLELYEKFFTYELSKGLRKSFTHLTRKVDFYSLNVF